MGKSPMTTRKTKHAARTIWSAWEFFLLRNTISASEAAMEAPTSSVPWRPVYTENPPPAGQAGFIPGFTNRSLATKLNRSTPTWRSCACLWKSHQHDSIPVRSYWDRTEIPSFLVGSTATSHRIANASASMAKPQTKWR